MHNEQWQYVVGIDWASQSHHARIIEHETGRDLGERVFEHSGEGLHQLVSWILQSTGVPASAIAIAIEVPHGPLVELFLEHGFAVRAINPKQLDRFRDRYTVAGAKDDSLDCLVMASALRTDPHCFRKIEAGDPIVVELREVSRLRDELVADRTALTSRLREQLWRYFPAFLQLGDDLTADWLLELWTTAPTPAKAMRIHKTTIAAILKKHRIRRLDADQVLAILRHKAIPLNPASITAIRGHVASLLPRIRLHNTQIKRAENNIDRLLQRLSEPIETAPGQPLEHRDATILTSCPGIGRTVVATMLAEASQPVRERSYHALRCLSGVAPVTRRSGRQKLIVRRQAVNPRLAQAVYHWARVAVQREPTSRQKYAALRARGHGHARALRSIADRLLYVACAMLKSGTLFSPKPAPLKTA